MCLGQGNGRKAGALYWFLFLHKPTLSSKGGGEGGSDSGVGEQRGERRQPLKLALSSSYFSGLHKCHPPWGSLADIVLIEEHMPQNYPVRGARKPYVVY